MTFSPNGLTIGNIEETHRLIQDALSLWTADQEIDLSEVTAVDMSGIQLLISLKKTLAEMGFPFLPSGLSPYLENSIRLSGCTSLLETPHE